MQFVVHHEDPAPDDVTWLRNTFHCSAAESEIHWRLPFAARSFVSADEMCRRRSARYQKYPNVSIELSIAKSLSPAQIMQRVFRRKAQLAPQFVGHKPI